MSTSRTSKPSPRLLGATVSAQPGFWEESNKRQMFMLQLEESLVSFALVPLFSRTSIRHKHGDSQHGVQLGFHHKDALHQRGRDLSGFRVGGRGRWAFRDAFHQAKRNIFDFGDAPIGKSVSNQIRVGCCIPIRDRIFILVALL